MNINIYLAPFFALIFSVVLGRLLYQSKLPESLLDTPDTRKTHSTPTPLVGGITILFSLLIVILIFQLYADNQVQQFIFFAIYFFFIGLFDDLFRWDFTKKIILQIIGTIIFVYTISSNISIISFISFSSDIEYFNYFIVGLWILFIINAFNFFDGANFLAGSLAIVFFISFSIYYFINNDFISVTILLIVIFATLGFLVYNRAPAKMFLGDAGSMLLGFTIATFPFIFMIDSNKPINMTFFIIVVFILISDTFFVLINRIRHGKSPFQPDRTHLHHQFLNLDFKNRYVVIIIVFGAIIHSILAFISPDLTFLWLVLYLILINVVFIIFPRFLPSIFVRYNLWGLKKIYDKSINIFIKEQNNNK